VQRRYVPTLNSGILCTWIYHT